MDNMNFENYGLSDEILKALKLLGFKQATEVQKEVIPLGLEKHDIIAKAQTGSGKTAAFGIPICESVEWNAKEPQALVLTPTRELCVQVKEDITNIGRFKRIRCTAVFGKQPVEVQVRDLKQKVHVVVGTPGRTFDLIQRGHLNVQSIKYLVIDEADKMLNMGFIDQVEDIIRLLPGERITMLYSATLEEKIEALCQRYMNNPIKIEITPESLTSEKINQVLYEVEQDKKLTVLQKLLYVENPDSCIIFCSTKDNVDKLTYNLKDRGYACESLHGGMEQRDRLDIMKSFKRGEFRFLVATDVAARGIDVESLSLIINYDVPVEKESYVHRIGRTGRAGNKGKAITLAAPSEYKILSEIEEYIGLSIPIGEEPYKEEIERAKKAFEEKNNKQPKIKTEKSANLDKQITKIYIGAGKKKKIRAGDIVGAITSIKGISAENIGIIDVLDYVTYVDILDGKGSLVLDALKTTTIKGKSYKVEKANK
ncbi:DEAD/DEAH box helicase [Clostridium swellfunianum]|uniref:DEAD/DEAH box helicase n=1 Tax=Clostridium swellfunianum TaxID=1367462 RepID=UPI002030F23C|nr:DEAD/DEAH box helicase [Clostridium swellfunianum]MCM0648249.1 DEAD/DEAH box helicase [Clostridium swellfunianum]